MTDDSNETVPSMGEVTLGRKVLELEHTVEALTAILAAQQGEIRRLRGAQQTVIYAVMDLVQSPGNSESIFLRLGRALRDVD